MILPTVLLLFVFSGFAGAQLVDLGHELSEDTPVYPLPAYLENPFRLKVLVADHVIEGKYWLAFNSFSSIEHIGTHIDAPYHFYEFGWTLEQIPLENFIVQAIVIDVAEKAAATPNYAVSAQDVDNWITENGLFLNNSLVLCQTGWGKRWGNYTTYFGHVNDTSKFKSPGFGADAVEAINKYKDSHGLNIVGYGTDTISLDVGNSSNYPAHRIVQRANQYILENLTNLDKLPAKGATVIVMPMKIKRGTGAPARVVAQLPFNGHFDKLNPTVYRPTSWSCD